MRNFAAFLILFIILAGCSASSVRQTSEQQVAAAPDTVTGTWEFSVTGDKGSYSATFVLTDNPAETCLSGAWRQAQLVSAGKPQVSRPAYNFESGRLELLLSSELCDSYSSFIGQVSGAKFIGTHVSYGMFGSTEHGKVTGVLGR